MLVLWYTKLLLSTETVVIIFVEKIQTETSNSNHKYSVYAKRQTLQSTSPARQAPSVEVQSVATLIESEFCISSETFWPSVIDLTALNLNLSS